MGTIKKATIQGEVLEVKRHKDSDRVILVSFKDEPFFIRGEILVCNNNNKYKVWNDLQYHAVDSNKFYTLFIQEPVSEDNGLIKEITDDMISKIENFKLNYQKD
jgi:hypothetical protein